MTNKVLIFVAVAALWLCSAGPAFSQNGTTGASPAALTAGPRAEFLNEMTYYEGRFTQLAKAVPADKYNWRPAEGVRSIGEVYAHIAAANYGIARTLGTQPPAGVDFKAITASAGDKDKDIQNLHESFEHLRKAIVALSDADSDKSLKMFGHDTTQRGAFILVSGHTGEHLGQSIAYARMNGGVPPWTAEAESKAAEKPKQ